MTLNSQLRALLPSRKSIDKQFGILAPGKEMEELIQDDETKKNGKQSNFEN